MGSMSLISWAFGIAEQKLAQAIPRRWSHVQGVARQARTLRGVAGSDAELLEAAAVLHDVGYAPDLAGVGFHPLDGARFLRTLEAPSRLVNLVAHHSYAVLEARLRGIDDELDEFPDEGSTAVRDALWYCDLTTTPDGETTSARERISEIKERYGPKSLVTQFITEAGPELMAAVDRTERRLAIIASS
ncbi:HD domain-containing protein [Nonomuraea sp. NPDC046570]|uniref:HD domain-containing protein n=1 Tax=Nonomuraea sp. NPDC046570 TaxID=3155255 RepID=UPI0033DE37D7